MKSRVIVLGSGHLAAQVARNFVSGGVECEHELNTVALARVSAVYVVDEEDTKNIQYVLSAMALSPTVPLCVSLFNKDIAPHFRKTHPNLQVLSPAELSAPVLADALRDPSWEAPPAAAIPDFPDLRVRRATGDRLLVGSLVCFAALLAASTIFFHYAERLSWVDAFYFVVVMGTTVGFGDITLLQAAPAVKIIGSLIILAFVAVIWTTFSFVIDRLFKRRTEIALGHRRYRWRDHAIVCGLGRVGYALVAELRRRGERVVVIERDSESSYLESARALGASIYIGDATILRVLADAGVAQAAGLFSVINNDIKNLEIGLNARSLRPTLRLVLRAYDRELADEVAARFHIRYSLSTSAIAAEHFVKLFSSPA